MVQGLILRPGMLPGTQTHVWYPGSEWSPKHCRWAPKVWVQGKNVSRLGRTDEAQELVHGRDIFVFLRQGGAIDGMSTVLSKHSNNTITAPRRVVSPRLLSLSPPLLTSPVPAAELGPASCSFPESSNDIDGMTCLNHEQVRIYKAWVKSMRFVFFPLR